MEDELMMKPRPLILQVLPDLKWVIQTLVVLGVVATVMLIRVNFGADFTVRIPEAPELTAPSKKGGAAWK